MRLRGSGEERGEERGGEGVRGVEVWSGGEWRGVCDDGKWAWQDTDTVCKQLGYHGNSSITGSYIHTHYI